MLIRMRITIVIFLLSLLGSGYSDPLKTEVTQVYWGALDFGQVVRGHRFYSEVDHVWQTHGYLGLGANAVIEDRAKVGISGECHLYNSYPPYPKYPLTKDIGYYFTPNQIDGSYLVGDTQKVSLLFHAGYFPYKYNKDVKNLGEYMFRTGTYPSFILNYFDYPLIRLLGFHIHNTLWGQVEQDVILNSETQMVPLGDGSLTYMAAYTGSKLFDVGAGVSFSRLFPVDGTLTKGKKDAQNRYIDSVTSDTGYYTFQGTKLMGRASVDFKEIFRSSSAYDMFGKEDLRLYGEVAVLGLEEYPVYYENWRDRVPRMVGFNFPAFKILDVASVELQYNPNPLPNDFKHQYEDFWPLGQTKSDLQYLPPLAKDFSKWKWSGYFKRSFMNTFDFIAQVSCDNYRIPALEKGDISYYDKGEALIGKRDWQWKVKIGYHFSK